MIKIEDLVEFETVLIKKKEKNKIKKIRKKISYLIYDLKLTMIGIFLGIFYRRRIEDEIKKKKKIQREILEKKADDFIKENNLEDFLKSNYKNEA